LYLEKLGDVVRKPQGTRTAHWLSAETDAYHSLIQQTDKQLHQVLLVDPDPLFASTVSDYLKLFGYKVDFRTDVKQALNYASEHLVDVIFVADSFDAVHPIDALRKLKLVAPKAIIAILASRGDDQLAVELLKSGADDYISRRVRENDLLTSIAALLDKFSAAVNSERKQEQSDLIRHADNTPNQQTLVKAAPEKPVSQSIENAELDSFEGSREKNSLFEQASVITEVKTSHNIHGLVSESAQSSIEEKKSEVFESPERPFFTEQKQAEDDLDYPSLNQLPGSLFFLDSDLNILDVNQQCSSLLGFQLSEVINQSIAQLMPKQIYSALVGEAARYLQSEGKRREGSACFTNGERYSFPFELIFITKKGAGFPVKCQLNRLSIRVSDKSIKQGLLLSIEDLSLEKEKQAELLYLSMWNSLLQAFAHRFINLKLEAFSQELTAIVSETASFFKLDRVSIYLFDKNKKNARIYLEWLKTDIESLKLFSKKIEVEQGLLEIDTLLAGRTQILQPIATVEDPLNNQCCGLSEHYAQANTASTLILPISQNNEVIGWIALDHQKNNSSWQVADLDMVQPLARLFSEVFSLRAKEEQRKVTRQKLSENHGRLSEQAFLDGLTKLANRRYFDKVLESEVRRASRDKTNIALLFCDVDYFKMFNDTYGHLEGDRCLQAIAEIFQQEFQRAGDFVARFGGEEFAVILSGTLANDALESAEKLREQIVAIAIEHQQSPLQKITLSIGVASINAPKPDDAQQLLSRADKALYKAKTNGRNRVEIFLISGAE
jgi:diguanylate cyclase (GGDEF)-like protein